ncbi:5286_t:CDS:2 [Entrophospora sp. SA101]|nr:5286_t:CDS:2 [Entrophospora sp. SA101]CAJ0831615.1 2562_t:CDS:2 [Entrophospora sp. SA101]CAJ0838953.1 15771_t:CDS:2 [Entrophospora sp. SA101]
MDNVRCLICSRRLKSQDSLLLHVNSAHLNVPNTNKKARRKPKRRNGNDNSNDGHEDDGDDNGNGIDEIKKGDKDRNLIIIDDDDECEEGEIDNDSNDNDMSTNIIINDNDTSMGTINDKNNNIQIQENDVNDNNDETKDVSLISKQKIQHSNQTKSQTQNPPNINAPGLNNNTNSGSLPFFNLINFNDIGESVTMQFTSTTGQVVSRSFIRCKICNMNCESDLAFSLHKRQAH